MILHPSWSVLAPAVLLTVATVLWAVRGWRGQPVSLKVASAARVMLALLCVGVGLGPSTAVQVDVPREANADVVLMVDRTASMGAEDYDGDQSRMTGVVQDLDRLTSDWSAVNVSVLVFDDDAQIAVPFTTDMTAVNGYLQSMGWRPSTKAAGSDISIGVDLADQLLTEAAEAHPDRQRYLVYAGDGEQTRSDAPASFDKLADLITDALVLGYGTEQGAVMPVAPGSDQVIEIGGRKQRSRADPAALRKIADQLRARYLARPGPNDPPGLVTQPSGGGRTEQRPGEAYYWALALGAVPPLLYLLWLAVSAARAAREELG